VVHDPHSARRRGNLLPILVAAYAGVACLIAQAGQAVREVDWVYFWTAGHALVSGENPYRAVEGLISYPLYYPGPAIVVVAPFGIVPARVGWFLFALASGYAFGLGAARFGRALPAAALSACFLEAIAYGQWTPLLVAAAVIPGLGFLFAAKPTVGAALFAFRPHRAALLGALVLTLTSLLLMPYWPAEWWAALGRNEQYAAPALRPWGWLLLLAAVRWRTAEGRLLLLLSLIPQTTALHGALPLFLVAQNRWQGYGLALASFVAAVWQALILPPAGIRLADGLAQRWPILFVMLWLPALALVLLPRDTGEGESGPRE
jgi:hypothetical protein